MARWNSAEAQRAKQVAKGDSWLPFGGTEIRFIPFWTRIRLALLLLVGVEIEAVHVEIKNSGPKEVMAWVEQVRKIPGINEAMRIASEAFCEPEETAPGPSEVTPTGQGLTGTITLGRERVRRICCIAITKDKIRPGTVKAIQADALRVMGECQEKVYQIV